MIINPVAGRGVAGRLQERVLRAVEQAGARPRPLVTEGPWHAARLAQEAAAGTDGAVAVVGGDGTVHEVVNGLLQLPDSARAPLAVIPVGSGNDFVKMTGTPMDIEAAARRAVQGTDRRVDAGRANDRYFANGVGMGFDGQVAYESQRIHNLRGVPLYLLAVFRALRTFPCPVMEIHIDDQLIHGETLLCAVDNGRCLGGGFWLTPEAAIDDGLLDVCHARGLGRLQILRLLPEVMRGTHVDKEPVTMARGRRVHIRSEIAVPAQADGELFHEPVRELVVEVLPDALLVRA